MNNVTKVDQAIRINVVGGGLMVAIVAVSIALVASGLVSFGPRVVVWLVLGIVTASLTLWTARSMRQDRDDPAGTERRFEETATRLAAAVIVLGLASVAGLIIWALFG
jgi:hypothetical protein